MLLQRFNIFSGAVDIFWGAIFLVGGAYFLYRFALDMRGEWWALIPGFALIGVGASIVLPGQWSGFSFLGFLGISFLAIYLSNRQRWWAIIPGGRVDHFRNCCCVGRYVWRSRNRRNLLPWAWLDFSPGGGSRFHAMGIHTGRNFTFDGRCIGLYAFCGRA